MYNEITAWINSGRDYNTGVALYEKYGTSSSQKRLFRLNGPTKKNIECLDYELGKIIKGMKPLALRSAPVHPALAAPAANANIQSQPRVRKKKHPKVQKGQSPRKKTRGISEGQTPRKRKALKMR